MKSHGIRFGVIAGIGTILILLSAYFIDKKLMLSASVVWSTMIFYLIGMYMSVSEVRKGQEGFITFREGLQASMLVWIIANAMYHAFLYFQFNIFDTEMLAIQKAQFLEQNEQAGFLKEEMAEEMVENLSYGFVQTLTGYISSLLAGFAISAAIASWLRRDKVV